MFGHWKWTVTVAVVSVIAGWRDDPIVPADVGEIHIQRMPLADVPAATAVLPPLSATTPALLLLAGTRRAFPPWWTDGTAVLAIVRVHEQRRPVGGSQLERFRYWGPDVGATVGERLDQQSVIAGHPPATVLRPPLQSGRHV